MYKGFKAKERRRERRERLGRLVYIYKGPPRESLPKTGLRRFKG
jgi:hypothetical protein